MDINVLRNQIITAFEDKWECNDLAHRQIHFENVFKCGMVINEHLNNEFDPKLIMFSAYFHDLFAWSRVNHHELALHFIQGTDHPLIIDNLNPSEQNAVAWACYQHRASFRGDFKSRFSALINSADRELPGDVGQMLSRAILYRKKHFPQMSDDQSMEESVKHLKEKFGHGGYARYPEMYSAVFGEQLEQQRDTIMNM